jgi:hypothetical protein
MKQLFAILFVVALVASAALALPGAALAQDTATELPPPFCGDLAEADCQLLADSQAAMQSVTSMTTDAQLDMTISGLPDMPELPFQFAMNAVVHMDPAVSQAIQDLAANPPEDPAELRTAMLDWVLEFYSTLGLDMEMTVSLPELLAEQIGAEEGIEFPSVIRLPIRFVDGVMYMDPQPLAAAVPDMQADLEDEGVTGWIGFDYLALLELALEEQGQFGEVEPESPLELGMGMGMMMNTPEMRDWYGEFAEIQRLPDVEIDGAPQAVFETSVDLGKLLMSREFQTNLRQMIEQSAAASGEELDQQELGEVLLGLQMMAGILGRDLTFVSTQAIDLETLYATSSEASMSMDLGGVVQLLGMVGELPGPEWRGVEPAFDIFVRTTSGDFNSAPAVEPPDDVYMIPLEDLDLGDAVILAPQIGASAA